MRCQEATCRWWWAEGRRRRRGFWCTPSSSSTHVSQRCWRWRSKSSATGSLACFASPATRSSSDQWLLRLPPRPSRSISPSLSPMRVSVYPSSFFVFWLGQGLQLYTIRSQCSLMRNTSETSERFVHVEKQILMHSCSYSARLFDFAHSGVLIADI